MQQRPGGFALPRRGEGLAGVSRPGVPMGGVDSEPVHIGPLEAVQLQEARRAEEGLRMMEMLRPVSDAARPVPAPASPVLAPRDCTRVIIYGKAGCPACVEAIQDLIDRQVCFTYHDVSRDEQALMQLRAISGGEALVPVIIQVGVRGG